MFLFVFLRSQVGYFVSVKIKKKIVYENILFIVWVLQRMCYTREICLWIQKNIFRIFFSNCYNFVILPIQTALDVNLRIKIVS